MNTPTQKRISIPITDEAIRDLQIGDSVLLSGVMITGRDTVHKWFKDTFIAKTAPTSDADALIYPEIQDILPMG